MATTWPGIPTDEQIERAPEHIAWEYVALLAAAIQMAKGPDSPINHQVQEAFLVHVRNLSGFFYSGVDEFKKGTWLPTRRQDDIYAVDFVRRSHGMKHRFINRLSCVTKRSLT